MQKIPGCHSHLRKIVNGRHHHHLIEQIQPTTIGCCLAFPSDDLRIKVISLNSQPCDRHGIYVRVVRTQTLKISSQMDFCRGDLSVDDLEVLPDFECLRVAGCDTANSARVLS